MPLDPRLFLVGDDERLKIKARTRQLVKLAGGPELFQHSAGVEAPALSKYGAPSDPSVIRADVALALDRALEAPLMLSMLAELAGYRLVPIDGGPQGGEIGYADLAELARADADVAGTLAESLADGVIDIDERRRSRAAIARKLRRLHQVDRKLAAGGHAF